MINFFTFKWGTKYNYIYVNRLYNSLKKHCKQTFSFTCITDNPKNIKDQINIIDFKEFNYFIDCPPGRLFTKEKTILFKLYNQGTNILLDLDILIHNNLNFLDNISLKKPIFIWNYWDWLKPHYYDKITNIHSEKSALHVFGKLNCVYMNSSFVAWKDKSAEFIFDNLYNKRKYAYYVYNSLDRYLFYQHWRKNRLDFWPKEIFYTYNFEKVPYTFKSNYKICLFNNSHGNGYDLHQTSGWSKTIWDSYD